MRSTKRNYRQSTQKIKSNFALCVQKLFTAEQLPKKFFKIKKAHRLTIDFVLIPYHGKHYQNENEVYRSQPKSGTSHFHAYSCYERNEKSSGNGNGHRNKHCRQRFAFAYYGISFGKAKDFFEVYRKRFGIESSYRQSHQ